jgi:asparagine synthase (glutamine-hydrolysing)
LRRQWEADPDQNWDGFYAAMVVNRQGMLIVSADILGIFPVYYWQGAGVTLIGSSPEMFFSHPAFTPRLNYKGLIGVFLNYGLCHGKTIWAGVDRLNPGHQLRVQDGKLKSVNTYIMPEPLSASDLPFTGHVELLHEALDSAVRRHAPPGGHYGLLLSGGLDSRMLAGYMVNQGSSVHALTLGRAPDIELECAVAVAKSLEMRHEHVEIPADAYPQAAESLATWEFLSAGFNGQLEWGQLPYMDAMPSHVMMGHMLDGVIGGLHVSWDYDSAKQDYTFERRIAHISSWGFSPEELKQLMPDMSADVDYVLDAYREEYYSYSEQPYIRAQIADLRNRQRYHVGSAAWSTSFAAWPIVPSLDRRLLETAFSFPASSLAERRAQEGVAMKYFPELSALPLDRNSFYSAPLQPRLRYHLAQYAKDHVKSILNSGGQQRRRAGQGVL